ncbi:Exocyst complex, component Exoc1 [Metarhizium album ARSEF 1941]|uniref:Exocyst complex, component Exoc1 n=1 Tax=Metarhizium album (strain ARSEF 1941) TaxID=1081103 RepID=A0A0B2WSH5_METAS|nr:Exocyst complex, component Exoc1 [Metarhizium album ARSEF 1941]KHN99026.1 Exocyst complex, component Exoc1 [Metarhizium album ARSEF 1941]
MDRANGAGPGATAASRAQRFEDEKRRIIDSCFSKKDTDGSLLETYITHIRTTEYSSYPSTPPPPQARTPEAEKARVIIVAVRKSGRVRMHKSKENANGTFSIGKTWNLDDLTDIGSFTGPQVKPNYREWGGDTGFLVTLGKPYYWQAQTDKEKKFFIASLIKIYGKYTGGKTPELSGFDQRELDQVLGAGRRRAASPSRPPLEQVPSQQSATSGSSAPSIPPGPPAPPLAPPTSSTPDPARFQKSPMAMRPPLNGSNSPAGSFDSAMSRDRPADRPVDRPAPRWTTSQANKSQDSVANSFTTARSEDTSSQPPRSRNGMNGAGAFGRFGDPREPFEPSQEPIPTPPQGPLQSDGKPPPERRRPPMDPTRPDDRDLVPQPLNSQTLRKDPVAPPPRSGDRISPRTDTSQLPPGPPAPPLDNSKAESINSETPESTNNSTASLSVTTSNDALSVPGAPPEPGADARPGLGPMIRQKKSKGDIAGVLWKAATAASAFRPRPGGAGERLRQLQIKPDGPDGITGVVPAPPRPVTPDIPKPFSAPAETSTGIPNPAAGESPASTLNSAAVPEVTLTVPNANQAAAVEPDKAKEPKTEEHLKKAPRRSIVTGNDAKYLQSLGVDPNLLDDRSDEFSQWLDYFGWVPGQEMRSRSAEEIKADVEREINRAQAGGWLARFQEEDDRVEAIKRGIDLAMAECEELENLLTLYSVELSTLSDDITYIEAQCQGLQVQTANQKLLKKELESLLETCAITAGDLEALRLAPLENSRGLEDVERALVTLFKAMIKIDPSLGGIEPAPKAQSGANQPPVLNTDYGNMRIVREKKQMYLQHSAVFMKRLIEFMARQFDEACAGSKRALEGALSKKVDSSHYDAGRELLWKYGPLMLYARDVDLNNWNHLIQIYQDKSHPLYKGQFQNVISVWRKNARKSTGEETELLFSSQVEKQQEGVATAARKITVKRSQTLARALRSPLADSGSRATPEKSPTTDSRSFPYEVFAGVLDDLLPLIEMEQNFIIDFFHATTLEQGDFTDAVAASAPRDRRGGDLKRHRLMEPDRDLARRVTRSMEVIFAFLESELQRLMEWVVGQDPLQGVGVLAVLEKKLSEISQSNQDYLNTLLQKLHSLLEGRFSKFVEEQIKAIEETKVKINKRKGVISFFRVFPAFMTAVENMMSGLGGNLALRRMIDREYDRILKSMFDSLMVIARERPAVVGVSTGPADPEDKEALNFHILLIENMNHFLEETDTRGLDVLEEWKDQANTEYHEHMDMYLSAVIRRPLGKLLDYLENIEAQIQTGKSPTAIARQPSNDKAIFNKILGSFDSKEVRKGVEALRKRVEKHFGDADDPALSRALVAKVTSECEKFYLNVETRIGQVTTDVYGGDVPFEWPRADVKLAFR